MKFVSKKKNSKSNDYISAFYTVIKHFNINCNIVRRRKLNDDTDSFRTIPDNELNVILNYLNSLDIYKTSNRSWILAILLMLDTGVRINELIEIKNKNIDFSSRYIFLDETKSGKKRVVKFGSLSEDLLKLNYDINHEYLMWNYYNDSRMTKHSLYHFFDRLNSALNLDSGNVHPHRLRKTFATKLLRMGCPITTIQKLLGHSDIKMTMIYLEVDDFMVNKDFNEYYPY
nr:site-specific integrase [Acholeplasma hippikon]